MFRKIIFFLLFSPLAVAQLTQVSGTVKDPTGLPYVNGTISATLVISGTPRFTFNSLPYTPPSAPVGLDATGSFVMSLADVNQLTPSGGTWSFHVCSGQGTVQPGSPITSGPVCFDAPGFIITGAAVNISTQLTSASARLTAPGLGGGAGVSSINTVPGAFTFTGAGVSCASTTCTFSGTGGTTPWSNITAGANTNTGVFSASQPGTFTSAQMNENNITTLTGGGTCSPLTIANLGGSTFKLTDAVSSCVNIPTTGVTNAFTNGFATYVQNPNANGAGQDSSTSAVGYYSQVWCRGGSASSTRCWGSNFSVSDDVALPATLFGTEYDYTVNNNTTSGAGQLLSYRGNGQPVGDTFPAIALQTPQAGTGAFTAGFECQTGSVAGTSPDIFACLNVGQQSGGLSHNSQYIFWNASNLSGPITANIGLNRDTAVSMGGTGTWFVNVPGGSENFAVALTASAAIGINTLVKIDTANPDAVVACTTTDTVCHGFTQGSANVGGLCLAGGVSCPVVAGSGQKVQGVLGTGTCAIGNNVIVDTTSNGRIKCTAAQPAQGAWIGIAISAQSTVGSLVDILTKFQ